MNRKGFTFVELLGVIVLLGLVLVIAIPSITKALRISRIKSEEVFLSKLSDVIDSYVTIHSDEMEFSYLNEQKKSYQKGEDTITDIVKVYFAKIYIKDIIDDNLISQKDFKDPAYGTECGTNSDAYIEVYRDDDYVYCHKVEAGQLSCISNDYKESIDCSIDMDPTANNLCYVIDTCIWEE